MGLTRCYYCICIETSTKTLDVGIELICGFSSIAPPEHPVCFYLLPPLSCQFGPMESSLARRRRPASIHERPVEGHCCAA